MTANTPTPRTITAGSGAAPAQVADETPEAPDTARADAVRRRSALAAVAPGEAMSALDREAALGLRDAEIAVMRPLVPFAVKHGLSLDWLLLDGVRPMLARAAQGRSAG